MMDFFGSGSPLTATGIDSVLTAAGLGPAELWSVLSVETSGFGYLPDRRPKILFERHIFSRLTGGQYDAQDPDISQPTSGGYGPSGAHQYDRLNAALQLDETAALKSASWGLGQIMGENFSAAGYKSVDAMVNDMVASEDSHLRAMVSFISAQHLVRPLMDHNWPSFARCYNGPNYAANNYDGLLGRFYAQYSSGQMPDLSTRTAQIYLSYLGYSLGAVDGRMGPATRAAVAAFRENKGVGQGGDIDEALLSALKDAVAGTPAS
jgi:hypothetical protein